MAQDAPIDVNAVVDRMRQVVGVKTDIALGEARGHGSSAVSTWRRRGSVPYADCVMLAIERNVSLDWLLLGKGPSPPERPRAASPPGVAEPQPGEDSRVARMVGFIRAWFASHDSDDVAWLERTLARAVPEYGEWLAAHTSHDTTGDTPWKAS